MMPARGNDPFNLKYAGKCQMSMSAAVTDDSYNRWGVGFHAQRC
jgi:hypothetical protein